MKPLTWDSIYKEVDSAFKKSEEKIKANKLENSTLRKKQLIWNRVMYLIKKERFDEAIRLMSNKWTKKLFGHK